MNDCELHRHLIDVPGSRAELNTPVLILELRALARNIARMAAFCVDKGVRLRPHVKTHKSPQIAGLQLRAGAIGMCCARLGEAEALVENGVVSGLLITSPIVSPPGIARLVSLNARTRGLMCVVDHPHNVESLGRAFRQAGKQLELLVDVDPGFRRTGVPSMADAVKLFRDIRRHPCLHLVGVQFYCGRHQHIKNYEERKASVAERIQFAREIVAALREDGARIEIITGGGTGTHQIDAELGFFSEIQAGSYVFMDSEYLDCDLTGDAVNPPYEASLMVDSCVISANTPGRVTLDAGVKALSTDTALPMLLAGAPMEAKYSFMGDEHGALLLDSGTLPGLGERVTLVTPHCDPTVNLYSTYHVVEGDTLRALWPIVGRA
jgi:D-serine deaminase-like pyridoxal phosphate-dependent protein